jgi:hypothetical protein
LHERLKPELRANRTRVLRGPHLTALFEDWLAGRGGRQPEPGPTPQRQAAA